MCDCESVETGVDDSWQYKINVDGVIDLHVVLVHVADVSDCDFWCKSVETGVDDSWRYKLT